LDQRKRDSVLLKKDQIRIVVFLSLGLEITTKRNVQLYVLLTPDIQGVKLFGIRAIVVVMFTRKRLHEVIM